MRILKKKIILIVITIFCVAKFIWGFSDMDFDAWMNWLDGVLAGLLVIYWYMTIKED